MKNNRKHPLMDLGPEALADALIDLDIHSDEADALIERLIATPNVKNSVFEPYNSIHLTVPKIP